MTVPNPTEPSTSSTPPGTPPPVALPPAAEFRYGNEAPEYLRGKTAQEAAALLQQTVGALQQYMTAPAQPQQVQQYQPPPAFQPPAPDDYVTGATLNTMGSQFVDRARQEAQQYSSQAVSLAASGNLDRVRDRYSKEFAKYGPEIDALVSRIPKTDWSIDTLSNAVKVVLAGHIDDLVNDRVAQFQSSQDPALRSSGANGTTAPAQTSPHDGLTAAQKEILQRRGITPEVVREFAARKGVSEQVWYEQFGKYGIGDAS
jgi:hypothetical protein